MSFFPRLGQSIVLPLIALWETFLDALPGLLGGILILVFGYLLGEVIEILVIKGLNKVKFDKFIHKLNISKNFEKFDISKFIGVLLKWYIFVIFLAPAASLARMGTLSVLLLDLARWVPHFILAIIIVLFGWIAADVLGSKIESSKAKSKHLASTLIRLFVFLFILVIALDQVGVNLRFLQQVFLIILSAFAFGAALAIGIGFGLAMKDDAKKVTRKMLKKL